MENQDVFLKVIRKQLGNKMSLIDSIASVLNISYDAAHRRISQKSKFSLEETVLLSRHYNISLDTLFVGNAKVIVEKTVEIENLSDMLEYFRSSAKQISQLTKHKDSVLYYSAKDIPLFYFMEGTILSKFKAYVWLTLMNPEQRIPFEKFVISESFLEHMQSLKKVYEKVQVNEIWNDTTINSSLQQILYFYEAGLLNHKSAKSLYSDLRRIMGIIEKKSSKDSRHAIYFNELILLNNTLLIEAEEKLTMFVPYTLLGYFITSNEESCTNVHRFFQLQIQNSKPLNHSGIRDHQQFFNKAFRKIDHYAEKLDNQVDLMF